MDPDSIARALDNPIASSTLSELASRAKEVAIVFDDMTRPTPAHAVLPHILATLEAAGVADSSIRLISASGMHGAMNNIEFRKKLGNNVIERYAVYNHNPYENCDYIGDTASGTPVYINREYMSCDLRIGIGCITPHVHVGFGGGGKIILPGISGAETIKRFHRDVMMRAPESIGLGKSEGNVMRAEVDEVAKMAGLDFKIDGLLNDRGEITDLFAGEPLEAWRAGLDVAKVHYGTQPTTGNDIVICNAYARYNEMAICLIMALSSINLSKGVAVITVDSPEGQICHYLWRSFGKEYGGELYLKRGDLPPGLKAIVCSRYADRTMSDMFADPDSVTFTSDWPETLALLEQEYPGDATVAVIPDATMQYFADS
jgi:nickel-dependent lactate racemase